MSALAANPLTNSAICLGRLNRHSEAAAFLRRSVALNPTFQAHFALANALTRSNSWAGADEHYGAALALLDRPRAPGQSPPEAAMSVRLNWANLLQRSAHHVRGLRHDLGPHLGCSSALHHPSRAVHHACIKIFMPPPRGPYEWNADWCLRSDVTTDVHLQEQAAGGALARRNVTEEAYTLILPVLDWLETQSDARSSQMVGIVSTILQKRGTSSFGNLFFILAALSLMCAGIRRRGVLHSPDLA